MNPPRHHLPFNAMTLVALGRKPPYLALNASVSWVYTITKSDDTSNRTSRMEPASSCDQMLSCTGSESTCPKCYIKTVQEWACRNGRDVLQRDSGGSQGAGVCNLTMGQPARVKCGTTAINQPANTRAGCSTAKPRSFGCTTAPFATRLTSTTCCNGNSRPQKCKTIP